jgi:hypothetical protein
VLLFAVGRDLVQIRVEVDLVGSAPAVDRVLVAVLRLDDVIAFAGLDRVLPGVAEGRVCVGSDRVVTITAVDQVTAPPPCKVSSPGPP